MNRDTLRTFAALGRDRNRRRCRGRTARREASAELRSGLRVGAAGWLVFVAACWLAASGCELPRLARPPRQPIDGLRMTGGEEPATPGAPNRHAEFQRVDLRI